MRRVAVIGAAAVLLAAGAPAGAAPAHRCAQSGSSTVRENSVARVYRASNDATIACLKATGRRSTLAVDAYEHVNRLTLRGHYVAYHLRGCEASSQLCAEWIAVRDVRRARDLALLNADEPAELVLRSNGSFAWSVHEHDDPGGSIHRWTRRGTTRLDRGPRVDPSSLRLIGTKLEWRMGGERRRATLR